MTLSWFVGGWDDDALSGRARVTPSWPVGDDASSGRARVTPSWPVGGLGRRRFFIGEGEGDTELARGR